MDIGEGRRKMDHGYRRREKHESWIQKMREKWIMDIGKGERWIMDIGKGRD